MHILYPMPVPPPTPQSPRFAVVIPVYNHGPAVAGVVGGALKLGLPVFVVDDGSTDSTPQALASVPGITVLRQPRNLGKGAALLRGMEAARAAADFAVTMDADGQHDPADARALMEACRDGAPRIVVGRREKMLTDASIAWTSRFGRKFSNFWVRVSGGPRISDTQSGYRVYPIAEVLSLRSYARRFQFEVEVLVLAHWAGIPIGEAPVSVTYTPGGARVSHFRPFVDFWRNAGTFSRLMVLRALVPRFLRRRWAVR